MVDGQTAEVQHDALIGEVVNGHVIEGLLGSGGMGAVYVARHQVLGVSRAIKVIRDDQRSDPKALARFRQEAATLGRIEHGNVVQVIDYGNLANGWPFLCMELVEGTSLQHEIEREGSLPLSEALRVLVQLADALDYLHQRGVVHRDLKPANVILRDGDPARAKIIDFGLARVLSDAAMTRLTAEQQMLGSPQYMAPEQADSSIEISGKADVYALAGVAYEMISGKPVFPGLPMFALIFAHAQETPERLSERVPDLPPLLDQLLYACLSKRPADRPTADELRAHFERMQPRASQLRLELARTEVAASPAEGAAASILTDPSHATDPSGFRAAVATQGLAVVYDIADALELPRARKLRGEVARLDAELVDVEMDLAMAESDLVEATGGDRAELTARRDETAERAASLRIGLRLAHHALIECVEGARPRVLDARLDALYGELDQLLHKLR